MKSLKKKNDRVTLKTLRGVNESLFSLLLFPTTKKKRFFQFVSLILGPMCYQLDDRPSIGHRFLTLVKYFSGFYGAREVAAADR